MSDIKYVWFLTSGTGQDGDEWDVESVHATKKSAEIAKRMFDASKYTPDTNIEKWELKN